MCACVRVRALVRLHGLACACMRVRACVCARACVRSCVRVRACVTACMRTCVHAVVVHRVALRCVVSCRLVALRCVVLHGVVCGVVACACVHMCARAARASDREARSPLAREQASAPASGSRERPAGRSSALPFLGDILRLSGGIHVCTCVYARLRTCMHVRMHCTHAHTIHMHTFMQAR